MEDFNETRKRQDRELLVQDNPLQLYPETLDQLLEKNFPPREWLVDGLLAAQAMTLLSAAPNSFKTFLMLDMALAISQGNKLFGELSTKQTNVLIIDEETQDFGLYERFNKLSAPKGLPIYWFSRLGHKITDEGYVESIISQCVAKDIGLVMVDSLTRLHNGDENTVKDMSKVMNEFKRLTDYGIAVMIIHHTRKDVPSNQNYNPDSAIRGSSEIYAAADSNISMRRIGSSDDVEVRQTKNRFQKPQKPFKIQLVDTDDDRVALELQEWLLSDQEIEARLKDEIKGSVLQVIEANPGLNQGQLRLELVDVGHDMHIKTLRKLLAVMENDDKSIENRSGGKANAYSYYIKQQVTETNPS